MPHYDANTSVSKTRGRGRDRGLLFLKNAVLGLGLRLLLTLTLTLTLNNANPNPNLNPNPKTALFKKKIDHDPGPDPAFCWQLDQGLNTVLGKTEEPEMQVARSICKLWHHITDPYNVAFFHLRTESSILCELTECEIGFLAGNLSSVRAFFTLCFIQRSRDMSKNAL